MTESVKKRPTAVTVIAWFWFLSGCWSALASVVSFWSEPPSESLVNQAAKDVPLLAVVYRHYTLAALSQFAYAAAYIVAGIGLLRLRAWARTTVEVIAWVEILFYSVGPILHFIYTYYFTGALAEWSGGIAKMPGFLVLLCGVVAVVNGLIIYFLRSKKVREAVA